MSRGGTFWCQEEVNNREPVLWQTGTLDGLAEEQYFLAFSVLHSCHPYAFFPTPYRNLYQATIN